MKDELNSEACLNSTQEEIQTSLMWSGGIKEVCILPENLRQHEVNIEPNSEVILVSTDMGKKKEKDDYFVPNLHNGLFRIHAFLYDHGIKSVMIDPEMDNMDKAKKLIAQCQPPFIAFSPYYDSMQNDLNNISLTRKLSPNSIIVIGGFEASLNPQWNTLGGLVDILVRGEGEFPLLELIQRYKKFINNKNSLRKPEFLDYLKTSFDAQEIPGMSIADTDESLQPTCVKERIDSKLYQEINLTAFQKHLSLYPIKKYWKLSRCMFDGKKDTYFRFVTSDHCPHKCIFCQSSIYYAEITGKKRSPVRYIEPENILKIIKAASEKYPFITGMYIDDENIFINRKRAVQTLEMIIGSQETGKLRKDLVFQCRTRTDNIDSEICNLLKQANFETVALGSESYSAQELEYMRKNISPEQNLKAVKTILSSGLSVAENYILYTPVTTANTFYESASQICRNIGELNVDGAGTRFLTPFPGTELWGDGGFEVIREFPYQQKLFKNKVMFCNHQLGYECIGEKIMIPGTNAVLPHPEIVLPNDSLMCKASLDSLLYLPKTVEYLREIAGELALSRSFVTLANLSSISKVLYGLTDESRWYELNKEIDKIVVRLKE